jgi:hypothetical protein
MIWIEDYHAEEPLAPTAGLIHQARLERDVADAKARPLQESRT